MDKNVLPRVEYYLGEYGKSQPVSRVLGYWQSILPVPLEGAVADFLDLNLEESNRIVDIFIDLVTEFPPAKRSEIFMSVHFNISCLSFYSLSQ